MKKGNSKILKERRLKTVLENLKKSGHTKKQCGPNFTKDFLDENW